MAKVTIHPSIEFDTSYKCYQGDYILFRWAHLVPLLTKILPATVNGELSKDYKEYIVQAKTFILNENSLQLSLQRGQTVRLPINTGVEIQRGRAKEDLQKRSDVPFISRDPLAPSTMSVISLTKLKIKLARSMNISGRYVTTYDNRFHDILLGFGMLYHEMRLEKNDAYSKLQEFLSTAESTTLGIVFVRDMFALGNIVELIKGPDKWNVKNVIAIPIHSTRFVNGD